MDARAIDLGMDLAWPRYPYPGLRPFRITAEADESLIFHGRSSHRDDVLERLDTSQLVSVVGPSGCGKSSLVKVGIIPVLKAGLLTRAGYDWLTIEMRPGRDPLGNLAAALAGLNSVRDGSPLMAKEEISALLAAKRSALWMIVENMADQLLSEHRAAKPKRVLLLLDQFEEIFSGATDPRDVDRFVTLITQFFRNPHPQLFTVLTMRTDFISQCANFPGLAELLNKTQYITPVLRGQGLIDAIEQPAETYGGKIEPELVAAIVHDMGAGIGYDADHLPLMQHALLWLWQQAWPATGLAAPPRPGPMPADDGPRVQLTLSHYREHGGLHGILNRHADEIFARITAGAGGERRAAVTEAMFRRLSERDAGVRYKRAPTYAHEICQVAQCTMDELNAVIEPFAGGDASFVERRRGHEPSNPLLDLSHESLIRQWERLTAWADAEAEKLATLRKVANDAESWVKAGKSRPFLKTGGQLRVLREWWRDNRPGVVWASRYSLAEGKPAALSDSLKLVEEFQAASVRSRNNGILLKFGAGILMALAVVLTYTIVSQVDTARSQREKIAAVTSLINEELSRQRPATALHIALKFLDLSRESSQLNGVILLAQRALKNVHEVRILRADPSVNFNSIDYSSNGQWLLASGSGQVRAWSVGKSNETLGSLLRRLSFGRALWSADGSQLLLSSEGTTRLVPIDADRQELALKVETLRLEDQRLEPATKLGTGMFSGDGRSIVTGLMDAPLRVWDAETRTLRAWSDKPLGGFVFAVNADASLIAVPNFGEVDVYRMEGSSLSLLRAIPAFRPDSRSGAQRSGQSCTVTGQSTVRALTFDPMHSHRLVFTVGCDVIAADARSGEELFRLHGQSGVSQVALSKDGARMATGSEDGVVRLYKIPSTALPAADQPVILGRHEGTVSDLRFSPDGKQVASSGRDATIRLWSIDPPLSDEAGKTLTKQQREKLEKWLVRLDEPVERLYFCLMGVKEECSAAQSSSE